MAGTTVNEQNIVYKTLQKSINEYGIDVDLKFILQFGAGKEKHQAIKDVLTLLQSKRLSESEAIFKNFKKILNKAYKSLEVKPIDGVENILLKLRQQKIIVILNTGYSRKIATYLLDKLKWYKEVHYDMLITPSDVKLGRPHPEMIQKAMREFNIKDSKQVLKAGDSIIDIEEGKNANCGITIGVLSGAQTKEQLQEMNPTFILNSLADLEF